MSKKLSLLSWLIVLPGLFRLSRKHPVLMLIILVLSLGGYGYEVEIARPPLLYQGSPQARDGKNIDTWFRILRNHGFILGYSDLRGNPLWVEYALIPADENTPSLKRPNHFETDWRSINRVSHESYQKKRLRPWAHGAELCDESSLRQGRAGGQLFDDQCHPAKSQT
jgi:hypothetical protein